MLCRDASNENVATVAMDDHAVGGFGNRRGVESTYSRSVVDMIRDPILVESIPEPAQAVAPKEPAEHKTAWITVSFLIGAGVLAATQIGKGIISLPTLQDEFGLAYVR